jgi:hypothetical protein
MVDGGAGFAQNEAVSLYILRVLALVVFMFHDTSVHSARHQDSVDISSKKSFTSKSLHWFDSVIFVWNEASRGFKWSRFGRMPNGQAVGDSLGIRAPKRWQRGWIALPWN